MKEFLSTPSARRATCRSDRGVVHRSNFYPRPPRGGRPALGNHRGNPARISIHALREEGDFSASARKRHLVNFYPRPPRGGRRVQLGDFQAGAHFYPRPPRGGRRSPRLLLHFLRGISIHALREEGDGQSLVLTSGSRIFLSTPSARRATAKTERNPSAFVSLYTSLHKLQRGACKTNRKITPLLAKTAGIPVRSVPENHVHCLFALAGHHPDIKRSTHYPVQTPGAVQRARPWSGNCCPAGRTADCPRQGRSGRSALP